jgi:hypothetical protein
LWVNQARHDCKAACKLIVSKMKYPYALVFRIGLKCEADKNEQRKTKL